MITPLIFDLAWHCDAAIVCVAALGLLWQLRRMQPVAQVAKVCSECRRVARDGDEGHGEVTLKLVVIEGRRG